MRIKVLLVGAIQLFAAIVSGQGLFDTLKNCREEDRVKCATSIYYASVYGKDSTTWIRSIDELKKMADQLGDERLVVVENLIRGELLYNDWRRPCMAFFRKGLELAEEHGFYDLKAQATHDIGLELYREGQYNLAFEHLLKANYFIRDFGYDKYPYVSRYLTDLGEVYWVFGDYQRGKEILEDAARFPSPNLVYQIHLNNTLGLCNRDLGNMDAAKRYFLNTIEIAKQGNQMRWVGIASGNVGSIYFKMGKYDQALPMVNIDYQVSSKEGENPFSSIAMLAELYVKKGNQDSAAYFLDKASKMLRTLSDNKAHRSYYNALAGYLRLRGDYSNTLKCIDSTNYYDRQIQKADLANIKSKAEQKAAVEKYLADIALIKSRQETQVVTRNAIIALLVLGLVTAALVVRNFWLKRKSDREQLANASEQLHNYIENIKEKTGLITRLEEQLQTIDLNQNNQETIAQLQNHTILTEDHWNEFKRLFEKVHADFFIKLKQKHPGLTPSEVRLMALIKLNLGKKEMASMLGISPDSVNKTRQRVKKKLELAEDYELDELAISI